MSRNNAETFVMYHGTTHAFEEFSGERTNDDNMFGRQIYFTSSREDAEKNYAREEGPDLRNRIELRADALVNEEDLDEDEAARQAREELFGGHRILLTVEVEVKNLLRIGAGMRHDIVADMEDLRDKAIEKVVAENSGCDQDEDWEDAYDDEIWEAVDEMRDADFEAFSEKVHEAMNALGMSAPRSDAFQILYELLSTTSSVDEIFQNMRNREDFIFLFEDEYGRVGSVSLLAELFHISGYDAILVEDACAECHNMDMEPGTSHLAVSLRDLSGIRIVERCDLDEEMDFGM